MHEKKFLHRDIKPENFLIGNNDEKNMIYAIDFGISNCYTTAENRHIPFSTNHKFYGTVRYASLNIHKGYEYSRRDDLEAIFYLLIYFVKGELPW